LTKTRQTAEHTYSHRMSWTRTKKGTNNDRKWQMTY